MPPLCSRCRSVPRWASRDGYDQQKDDWALRNEQGRTVRRFDKKDDATAGGVLKDAVGGNGGTVRIHKENGVFQEERTFPRSRDPKSSPG